VDDWATDAGYDAYLPAQTILAQISAAVVVTDRQGNLLYANPFAAALFGFPKKGKLLGRPVRVTEIDPGLVETDFSMVRFRGDRSAADAVYEGVEAMRPVDIAECVLFALTRPPHVNVDELVVKALAQSSGGRILRS